MNPAEISRLIQQGLPAAEVQVSSDDGTHFAAQIIDAGFAGKPPLARHKMVYAILGERMGREIHALSLRTLTPDEWQRQQQRSQA
ncbi:MAG: BolA/IbaG family iron-sulfur metabolism protein [Gammaproteobacteria bacterium]|nr:BolA/IbaG family iron-sulfur metabolism protein [Gammaproteobacteria bacterium]MDE2344845.1 BolA/IbaG family iron-sulfur metabolism protein [Gammaproteobacteria bacterium]